MLADAFTLPQLSKAIGTPYRTLHSWVERGVLRPSVHRVKGTGRANLFDVRDAFAVLVLTELREAGVKFELLGRTAERLRETLDILECPVYLLVNGDVIIVRTRDEATRAIERGGLTVAYYTGPAIERISALRPRLLPPDPEPVVEIGSLSDAWQPTGLISISTSLA